uniref:17-beta-hydroxysteroid dehydrogenase 14-like n=1 Tax=Euleptes europaea TaxID=460621 RepID=UPI00253FCDB1|nr:17-beta-hydroxysteroid dehydrogenase 14-like [Euleptes europaea]
MAAGLRYPGKVVIVTGGTSGIGLATVREFVRQGATVVFCTKPSEAERGRAIERELQCSGCPGKACFRICDVCKEDDIKRLIQVTLEHYGCLDCLVNNAGAFHENKIDDVTAQDFWNVMKLNTVSVLLASKYALPYLRETRGNIINIACITATTGAKNTVAYCPSKGAVVAMTKALAIDESKYGVRVNSISPGQCWTPSWVKYANQFPNPEAKIQEFKSFQLMGRMGTPEEVALAVLFLAADGTFCTGLDLHIFGGADVGFGVKNEVDLEPCPSRSGNSKGSSSKE